MTAPMRGGVTAAASATLALTAFIGHENNAQGITIAAILAVAVAFFAAGWPRLLGIPAQRGASTVIALSGFGALVIAVTTHQFRLLPIVLAAGVVASFVHQMLRTDGRPRLVESVSATVTGVIVVTLGAGWVTVVTRYGETDALNHPLPMAMILVGACSLTGATIGSIVFPRAVSAYFATLLATGIGTGVGWIFPSVGWLPGLITGFSVGVLYTGMHILFGMFPASRRVRPAIAAALLPVLASGIVVYIVARAIATVEV